MKKLIYGLLAFSGIVSFSYGVKANIDDIIVPEDVPFYIVDEVGATWEFVICPGSGQPCDAAFRVNNVIYKSEKNASYDAEKYPKRYTFVAV